MGIKSKYIDGYKKRWLECKSNPAKHYGPCIQTVSISQHVDSVSGDCQNITTETCSPKILLKREVGGGDGTHLPRLSVEQVRNVFFHGRTSDKDEVRSKGTCVKPQRTAVRSCLNELLREDKFAKKLAFEHKADIVLTDRVISSMLKSEQWSLPISIERLSASEYGDGGGESSGKGAARDVIFIEDPVPSSSRSRECLSYGMTESLYGQMLSGNQAEFQSQFVYTLLKKIKHGTNFHILVRSQNYILNEDGCALSFDVSLEYFSDRGLEVIPVHDRADWFMRKVLQPGMTQLLCRIDPSNAEMLHLEEKTVADAITAIDEAAIESGSNSLYCFERSKEPGIGFLIESTFDVLIGTTKLERDLNRRSIMCYPGHHGTVLSRAMASVHKETMQTPVVDIMKEIDNSYQVFLTPDYRSWTWENDRVPYTFPIEGGSL